LNFHDDFLINKQVRCTTGSGAGIGHSCFLFVGKKKGHGESMAGVLPDAAGANLLDTGRGSA